MSNTSGIYVELIYSVFHKLKKEINMAQFFLHIT